LAIAFHDNHRLFIGRLLVILGVIAVRAALLVLNAIVAAGVTLDFPGPVESLQNAIPVVGHVSARKQRPFIALASSD
jgi:hypothetical protein